MDGGTGELAFTDCVFKNCNIVRPESDEEARLVHAINFIDRRLVERRVEFVESKGDGQAP
jgi:hypothetical protein